MKRITVFGASDCSKDSMDYINAMKFGALCGERGYSLVTGGYAGVMQAVFEGAANYNVEKIGVTTSFFNDRNANEFVTEHIVCSEYIERMVKLIELGDAYIVFPGGPGTLTELSAVWTLQDRKVTVKPIITIGEQWHEIIQLMNYYSEKSLIASDYLEITDNYLEAFNLLNERLA